MDVDEQAIAAGLRRLRINKQLSAVKEDEYAVSPSSPLVSTALDDNGWVCGSNHAGQLGVGGTADVQEPQVLQVVRHWAALSLGGSHAAGVSTDAECYTWGCNDLGQLGYSAGENKHVPTKMDILRGWDVKAIACGADHTVAITPEDIISWGGNSYGQCGQGERAEVMSVKPRSIKPLQGISVAQIVCGRYHTLCVTATSQVFSWGCNSSGQLGLGDFADRRAPAHIEGLWALPVASLAAGDSHSAALTMNGFLFCWGANDKGQLGLPRNAEAATQVQRTTSERQRARRIVNQRFLTAMLEMGIPLEKAELALSETGNVGVEVATEWLFSVPDHILHKHLASDPNTPVAEVSTPEDHRVYAPRRVPLQSVRAVAAGGAHTVAVTERSVYSWGSNSAGQLGSRTFRDKAAPTEVRDLSGRGVVSVACGSEHSLFLCRDGTVHGCGSTEHGQLPYLRYSREGGSEGADEASMSAAELENLPARNEITIPTGLRLPVRQSRGGQQPVVSAIAAGGNSSAFLTSTPDEFPDQPGPQLLARLQSCIEAAASAAPDVHTENGVEHSNASRTLRPLLKAVEMVFGSAAALSATFGYRDKVGINAALLDEVQTKLLGLYGEPPGPGDPLTQHPGTIFQESVTATLYKATMHLLDDLHNNCRMLGVPERAQVVLAAMQSPLLADSRHSSVLVPRLCSCVLMAPQHCRHTLVNWWSDYPEELLTQRVLQPLQRYLTTELVVTKKLTVSVMNTIKVLAKIEEANQIGRNLPPEAFYNELISEKLDVEDHYVAWRQTHDSPNHGLTVDGPFSFCSFPFLLNPRAKSKLLHTEARCLMTQTIHQARAEQANSSGRQIRLASSDERVLPDVKAHLRQQGDSKDSVSSPMYRNERERRERRRRDRNSLRGIWQGIWRNQSEQEGGSSGSASAARPAGVLRHPSLDPGSARTQPGSRASQSSEAHGSRLPSPFASAEPSLPDYQVDERMAVAREVTALRSSGTPGGSGANSPTAAMILANASGSRESLAEMVATHARLFRQGSMNLPKPEDSGVPATHPDMCILRIRRQHLLEDALNEIARQRSRDLFKPLRVHFIGEDGIDAGGVKKEFFQLLMTELLSPDYGMLVFQPDSRTYWFNASTLEAEDEFMLVGLVLGLAVYNAVLLDFPLPIALYRKLLGQPTGLRDLREMDPPLGRSLQGLLDLQEPELIDSLGLTFTAGIPGIGEPVSLVLCESGDEVPVTAVNLREYVQAYVDCMLNTSVEKQFEAFARGFMMLCGGPAIHLFSATELERLVCGNPILDFSALQGNARYDGGYHAEHKAVKWLWEIVNEFDDEERRRFLKFFTGSDRAPIGGLGNLRCVLQRDGPDSQKLPTSHTCFNTLLLPSYRAKEVMADRLKLAIMNSEGFGLE